MLQRSQRITDAECFDCWSASLNSKDEGKICGETERPYTQGWAAVDHKELMASIETEQETCCTTTPWSSFLPEVSAAARGLVLTKTIWPDFSDQLIQISVFIIRVMLCFPSFAAEVGVTCCIFYVCCI